LCNNDDKNNICDEKSDINNHQHQGNSEENIAGNCTYSVEGCINHIKGAWTEKLYSALCRFEPGPLGRNVPS